MLCLQHLKPQKLFVVIENGFGNLDLLAVESFGKVMEILTALGVRTPVRSTFWYW
jgi:hypothetical protein